MSYRLSAEIPGLQKRGIGYSFDPTIVIDALIQVFETDLTFCIHDLAWQAFDYFASRAIVSGAINVAENDARRRAPVWMFRIRTGTDQIVRGHAERYVVELKSDQPIPESIVSRFVEALRGLRFEPLRLYRDDGDYYDRVQQSMGEPSWAAIDLFPRQGDWSEADYLRLDVNRFVELVDGRIEVPPPPTDRHQEIAGALFARIRDFMSSTGRGRAILPPFPIRLRERTFRMPDVPVILRENYNRRCERYWKSADFVAEVASNESYGLDRFAKACDYARAGVPEYWIANLRDNTLTIFTLDAGATAYREAGRFKEGETAASVVLDGLSVDVSAVFAVE